MTTVISQVDITYLSLCGIYDNLRKERWQWLLKEVEELVCAPTSFSFLSIVQESSFEEK